MAQKRSRKWFANSFAALSLLLVSSSATAGQASPRLTGAIFTTTFNGIPVNSNIYVLKEDVYLDGGPQPNAPCTAAGLSDGDYYFQVTDPSGKTPLSIYDVVLDRKVRVLNGIISEYLGTTPLRTGMRDDCGSITVQLFPFASTPNMGGEYKVWMTKVGDYDLFGFIPSKSKTDNFKVPNIDSDGDGIPDGEDPCPIGPCEPDA